MKFSEMKYEHIDAEAVEKELTGLTEKLSAASSFSEAEGLFLEKEKLLRHVMTEETLCSIRHSIDTNDKFYSDERTFWDEKLPEMQKYLVGWTKAMLDSPYRKDFEAKYGSLMFLNAEISLKTFSPEIIPDMQEENKLTIKYENLLASAQIPFEGGKYTIPEMTRFKTDSDDSRRLAAWKAEGQWYKDNQEQLDSLYDRLVELRDGMGRKLGYKNYLPLGYYRMGRNCYGIKDVEKFREAVRKFVVPVAEKVYKKQAERLGKTYPMSFADNALEFRSGNPRPQGTADDVLRAGKKFYDELSPETSEFFNIMLQDELMDVLSKKGKEGGGYCTGLPDYGVPFIFANFNGTQHDVEVVTHEAGHAFAAYVNRNRIPLSYIWPSMEGCEVHSMSMEFMSWPWSREFFGDDADKFHYSHLAAALTFIPYGTMVDHFQHIVYENPDYTPAERHAAWKKLMGIYNPWHRLDGDIPFYSEGEGWQRQHHIYSDPLYYIDYCLAQTVSLEFWDMIQSDRKNAWDHYMAYTKQGGSRVFTELLANAGLKSPFDEDTLRGVCDKASRWLDDFDSSKIV
ncbi:MAG: M3 family oligoendopeptidase [Oscillospiraceae bacterium]|jgi:M3 family oligoendopeptidase